MADSTTGGQLVPVASPSPVPARPSPVLAAPRPADACPVTLYLANDLTTEASRRGMRNNLRRAARTLTLGRIDDPRRIDWTAVDNAVVGRLRTLLLEEGAAPNTVNTILAGVKGILRQCWRLELISHEQLARATDVKPARGERVDRKGRALSDGEIRALLQVCCDDPSPAGTRDAAIFALALGAGLRRAEITGLELADHGHLLSEPEVGMLTVAGKGNKERRVFVTNGAKDALDDWRDIRGTIYGRLFVPINKGGHLDVHGELSGQALSAMMRKRAAQAGVAAFTPHDCRRTYISGLLDRGVDISTAADLAGHASVETTRIYDRRGERAAVKAAHAVHIPYVRTRLPLE